MDEEIKTKLKDLEDRIDQIKEQDEHEELSTKQKIAEKRSSRAGSEFLASVIAGGILGFMIDNYFSTAPFGIIFFMFMGFVSGVYRANAVTKKNNEEV